MPANEKWYVVLGAKGISPYVVPEIKCHQPNDNVYRYLTFNGFSEAKRYAIDLSLRNTEVFKNEIRGLRALKKYHF